MNRRELSYECGSIRSTLAEAVSSHFGYTEHLPLSQTSCGFATALLQAHLHRRDVTTERLIATPPLLPRTYNGRKREHVVLRTEDDVYIDPTYQQFVNLVGYSRDLAGHMDDVSDLLPPPIIVTYDRAQYEKVGTFFAQHALAKRAIILNALESHLESITDITAPLAHSSPAEMHEIYKDIWNPQNYRPYPLDADEVSSASFRRADDIMKQRQDRDQPVISI